MKRKKPWRRWPALLLAALVLAAAFAAGRPALRRWKYPVRYEALVQRAAAENGLPPALLYAVIHTESGFRPDAVSGAGARGLTQIMPETFRWLQGKTGEQLPLESLFEPEVSIRYGALLLGYLMEEFGSPETALAAYHAGRGRVNQWLRDPARSPDGKTLAQIPIPGTRHYVAKVLRAYEAYLSF